MTHDAHPRMIDTPLLALGSLGLIIVNFILGFAATEIVNVLVAFTGLFITLMANVHKIVYGFVWILEVKRAGWKLPSKPLDNSTEVTKEKAAQ